MALMLFSTAGYALNNNSKTTKTDVVDYRGTKFVKSDSYWYFNAEAQSLIARYNPEETKNISFELKRGLSDYKDKPLYFVNGNAAAQMAVVNLQNYYLRYQEACINSQNCSSELPVKTCNDNVIIYQMSNETKVWQNNRCVYISGDFIKGTDAFLYRLFGVTS